MFSLFYFVSHRLEISGLFPTIASHWKTSLEREALELFIRLGLQNSLTKDVLIEFFNIV